MDLTTTYLGLKLSGPFMPGASPLVDDLGAVKRLEDSGASAIVMHSLFEEQITREQISTILDMEMHAEAYAEALSYFPEPKDFALGPEPYLEQVRRVKEAVSVPVIASLNGTSPAGWLEYAKLIEEAGADALELNVYYLATNAWEPSEAVEKRVLDAVKAAKSAVSIPLAVKLSPFYSSLTHLAHQLDKTGVGGLVLFNRFYQPDIDVDNLEIAPTLKFSDSSELLLRLRWLAILAGRLRCSLAASGGVHSPVDAVKAIMAGADVVQVVSALLIHGPRHLKVLADGLTSWMEEHEYVSLAQMHASMSHANSPNPQAIERANYMRILQSWRS
jgi:dihydroorotate dehydrogenase (fumarate)